MGTVPPASATQLEAAKEELDKGAKQLVTRQKKIRMADRSDFSWATVEAYESDDLADEKRMEKVEKEAARCLAKKRSRRGRGSFSRDTYGTEAKRHAGARRDTK